MNIHKTIDQAPGQMSRISQQAEDERCTYARMKEEVKRVEAKVYLSLKAENGSMTVKELEAEVTMNNEVYKSRLDLIEQESKHRKLDAEFDSWCEALNASKMLAKMQIAEIKLG